MPKIDKYYHLHSFVGTTASCVPHGINKKFQKEAHSYYSSQESAMSCQVRNWEDYQVTCQHYKTSCKGNPAVGICSSDNKHCITWQEPKKILENLSDMNVKNM